MARAVKWLHDHVEEHGGDPGRIFLMGHSAGAHLVAGGDRVRALGWEAPGSGGAGIAGWETHP